jgi:hypothetical protein
MNVRAVSLRRACWLAIVAMLALALLPTVSHALAAARGQSPWAEICTPQGARVVSIADAGARVIADRDDGRSGSAGIHLEHCPFCSSSTVVFGMPPVQTGTLVLAAGGIEPPPRFLQAAHTLHAWRSAQPRAPPTFS